MCNASQLNQLSSLCDYLRYRLFSGFSIGPTLARLQKNQFCNPALEPELSIIRLVLVSIAACETCRCLSFIAAIMGYFVELHCKCLQKLRKLFTRSHLKFLRWYRAYTMVDKESLEIAGIIVAIVIGNGLAFFVMLNVASFRFYGNVSLSLYWIFPVGAFNLFLIFSALTPFIVPVHHNSAELIRLAQVD